MATKEMSVEEKLVTIYKLQKCNDILKYITHNYENNVSPFGKTVFKVFGLWQKLSKNIIIKH